MGWFEGAFLIVRIINCLNQDCNQDLQDYKDLQDGLSESGL